MKKTFIALLSIILFSSCGNSKKENVVSEQEVSINKEKNNEMKNVLFVLTSHEDLGNTGRKTGFWIEEFAAPYYLLKDKGIKITLASPKGGQPPIDPKSNEPDFQTPATVRFNKDIETQEILSKTIRLETINQADYDAIFYPGGHGPLWDLAEDKNSIALIEEFYRNDKPVAAVCHAPAVFKHTKTTDGTPLVKGKKVTGFTNSEEEAVELTSVVPFLVENMLIENGGIYSKKEDWQPYAIEDGWLITGQNPASSELVAELLFEKLNHKNALPTGSSKVVKVSDKHYKSHTEILIEASSSKVWSVLTNWEQMPNWSSALQKLEGEIKEEGKVNAIYNVNGENFSFPHTLHFEEGLMFGWSESTGPEDLEPFGGFVDNHKFIVKPISDQQTLFIQSDEFKGNGNSTFNAEKIANFVIKLYEQFNSELKEEVERSQKI